MEIAGVPYQNPLRYTGPGVNVIPILVFKREPTTTDVKYRIGTFAIIGKDPVSGTEGDLWYLSDFNASGEAVWLQLLTGAGSPGVDSITTDDGAPVVEPDGVGNIDILGGTGISVTGTGPGNTVTIAATGHITWNTTVAATDTLATRNGYFANRAGGVTYTLPVTANVGDFFKIVNVNVGGFSISQNATQSIRIGNQVSTIGVGGSLASTAIGDTLDIVCYVANTSFIVVNPPQGNITIT